MKANKGPLLAPSGIRKFGVESPIIRKLDFMFNLVKNLALDFFQKSKNQSLIPWDFSLTYIKVSFFVNVTIVLNLFSSKA